MKPVIICGGVGTKMWPESRPESPKHFLPIIEGKSLFELNYEALRQKFGAGDIYLQTNEVQAKIAKRLVPEIPDDNIFVEPEMRNQGPATGFAAAMLYKRGMEDEPFMLVQADVLRQPTEKFLGMMEMCDKLIRERQVLMTAGLRPDYAVMGVDYLVKGDKIEGTVEFEVFKMKKWLWRAEKQAVEGFVAQGDVLIHTNHYAATPRVMLEVFKKYRMDWYEPLINIVNGGDVVTEYAKMPKGPIEEMTQYALEDGLIMELPFRWIDFGTWESLARYLDGKGEGGGENEINIDSKNNFVRMPSGKKVALIGVEDLVVVDSGDGLLICPKSQSGRVGEVVKLLQEKNKSGLL